MILREVQDGHLSLTTADSEFSCRRRRA
jgi:hypothetical protein